MEAQEGRLTDTQTELYIYIRLLLLLFPYITQINQERIKKNTSVLFVHSSFHHTQADIDNSKLGSLVCQSDDWKWKPGQNHLLVTLVFHACGITISSPPDSTQWQRSWDTAAERPGLITFARSDASTEWKVTRAVLLLGNHLTLLVLLATSCQLPGRLPLATAADWTDLNTANSLHSFILKSLWVNHVIMRQPIVEEWFQCIFVVSRVRFAAHIFRHVSARWSTMARPKRQGARDLSLKQQVLRTATKRFRQWLWGVWFRRKRKCKKND